MDCETSASTAPVGASEPSPVVRYDLDESYAADEKPPRSLSPGRVSIRQEGADWVTVGNVSCCICSRVPTDPVEIMRCGHIVCDHCLLEHMRTHRQCPGPLCPQRVKRHQKVRNQVSATAEMYKRVRALCPLGCGTQVPVLELKEHIVYSCAARKVWCPVVKCQHSCKAAEMSQHLGECGYVSVVCRHCLLPVPRAYFAQHNCMMRALAAVRNLTAQVLELRRSIPFRGDETLPRDALRYPGSSHEATAVFADGTKSHSKSTLGDKQICGFLGPAFSKEFHGWDPADPKATDEEYLVDRRYTTRSESSRVCCPIVDWTVKSQSDTDDDDDEARFHTGGFDAVHADWLKRTMSRSFASGNNNNEHEESEHEASKFLDLTQHPAFADLPHEIESVKMLVDKEHANKQVCERPNPIG